MSQCNFFTRSYCRALGKKVTDCKRFAEFVQPLIGACLCFAGFLCFGTLVAVYNSEMMPKEEIKSGVKRHKMEVDMKIFSKPVTALFFAAALILGAAGVSQAAGDGPAYQARPYAPQLSPEQMAKAQEIIDRSYVDMQNTRESLAAKRAELDQQLASPNPDRGRIEALSREIGDLRGKMLSARVDVRNRLAQQGLPPDCFADGPARGYMGPGYGPCWGNGMMGGNGWYHHGRGHRGWRGHGGCWR